MENKIDYDSFVKTLEALGYKVSLFETKEEAASYMDSQIDRTSVGFGGSVTLKEIGLYEKLSTHNTVWWHNWTPFPEGMTSVDVRNKAGETKVYVCSMNGVSLNGELVNIDYTGNRISETLYGHEKVYIVFGKNKISPDYDTALWRARNVASPKNAQRLNRKTPCAVKGDKCYNCKSEDRLCRALSVFWQAPAGSKYEIVLIKEDLGF